MMNLKILSVDHSFAEEMASVMIQTSNTGATLKNFDAMFPNCYIRNRGPLERMVRGSFDEPVTSIIMARVPFRMASFHNAILEVVGDVVLNDFYADNAKVELFRELSREYMAEIFPQHENILEHQKKTYILLRRCYSKTEPKPFFSPVSRRV